MNIRYVNYELIDDYRVYKYDNYNIINCKTIKLDKLIQIYGLPELIKIVVILS